MKRMSWITLMVISLMLTALVGCSGDEGSDGGTGDVGSAQASTYFDHYNPDAWHGRGVAIVMCWGEPTKASCDINGIPLTLHGSTDKGRDIWTLYNSKGLAGTITCTAKDGSKSSYSVSTGAMQNGSC